MSDEYKTFDSYDEVKRFKKALLQDNSNSGFDMEYDYRTRKYVLTWNHREQTKDQKTLGVF